MNFTLIFCFLILVAMGTSTVVNVECDQFGIRISVGTIGSGVAETNKAARENKEMMKSSHCIFGYLVIAGVCAIFLYNIVQEFTEENNLEWTRINKQSIDDGEAEKEETFVTTATIIFQ